MRSLTRALLVAAAFVPSAFATDKPLAYTAEMVITSAGKTTRSHVWSDGTILKSQGIDEASGRYVDNDKKLSWMYGVGFSCLQIPTEPEGYTSTIREEAAGSESIDGHPTKKVKVTSSVTHDKKTTESVYTEWRASDLHDLVIRRRAAEGTEMHLEHVVLGKPEARLLAFPNPPCKYDERLDTVRDAPQAPGGFRTIFFLDAGCKNLVPLPLTLAIPSDYALRGHTHNCFWGTKDDLDRVLTREGPDFEKIQRGVFWCRASDSTEYDPVHDKFVSEQGTQHQWAASMKAMGAKNVVVTSKKIGSIPSVRVTAVMNGQRVYMLYLAVPGADSPAILINYHPAGRGGAADDAAWQHFIDSIEVAAK
jgi:hypothetical protein